MLIVKTKFKIPLLLCLLALIGWTSFDLYTRSQAALLWGFRPLVLFAALWATWILLRYKSLWRTPFQKKNLGLATLSGVLLGLGFPGWLPLPFLILLAFAPLLYLEKRIAQNSEKPAFGAVFKYTFHAFVVWNILSTFWIANSALAAGVFAIWVNSALMTLPFLLYHQTRRILPRLGFLPLLAYWLTFEYLHYHWALNYPWLTLGNAFAQFPAWVQWYEWTGVFGGSLWILLVNILIFKLIEKNSRRQLVRLSALIVLPIAVSLVRYFTFSEKGDAVEIVVVQPNYEPHYEEPLISEAAKLQHCIDLASKQLSENTAYLVLPETVFGFAETHQLPQYETFLRLREWMQEYPKLKIVTGLSAYRIFEPDEPLSAATRTDTSRTGAVIHYEMFNAAVQLDAKSGEIPLHKKSKLVPGPESFPFQRALFFLKPIVAYFGGTTAGLGKEPQPMLFKSELGQIAPLICYESVFGEYLTFFVRKGAQAFFIMTNDGWWDHTPGHRQHLYFASLRAIETRRSIARAANTGISAFINQRGDILQHSKYDEPIALKSSIQLSTAGTFYTRWGDMAARLSLFASIIFALNTFVRSIVKKEQ